MYGGRTKVPPATRPERVQSVLVFDNVQAVASQGVPQGDPDTILSLLSVSFEQTDAPSGHVTLTLAGDGAIRLDVEALEASVKDVTRPYKAPVGQAAAPPRMTPAPPDRRGCARAARPVAGGAGRHAGLLSADAGGTGRVFCPRPLPRASTPICTSGYSAKTRLQALSWPAAAPSRACSTRRTSARSTWRPRSGAVATPAC